MNQLDVYMGKRSKIVEENCFTAVIINDFYTAWHQIRTPEQHNEWARLVKKVAYFGTYQQYTLIDMTTKFGVKKETIMTKQFLQEVSVAYLRGGSK